MLNRELQQGSFWLREEVSVHWCRYNYQQAQTNTNSSEVTIETSPIDRSMLHPGGGPGGWLQGSAKHSKLTALILAGIH